MIKLLLVSLLTLGLSMTAYSEDGITKVQSPQEVCVEVNNQRGLPKELDGLMWNRWTSENFVVCSLNDPQAQYLHKQLELVKVWAFARWGMYDVNFSVQCKLICVDDKELFKKLFNLDQTKIEIRRGSDGKIAETIIFLLIDGPPSQTIPIPLTEICLAEFSQKYDAKFGLWTYKGMSHLNGDLSQIRSRVGEVKTLLDKNEAMFFSKGILEMTEEQHKTMPEDKKRQYENCSLVLCLMIRKEFGQLAYLNFLKATSDSNPELAVKSVLGFEGYDDLDRSLKRYMIDLAADIASGKTPDSYLQIKEARN